MTNANVKHLCSLSALLAALLTQSACSSDGREPGEDDALGYAVTVDQTTLALVTGQLASVNGTYGAGCRDQAGSWSIEIAAGALLDNAPLSVVLNDVDCVLTLTSLHTDAGIVAAVPAIALTASYNADASSFGEFYANAKLSAVTFASDFVVTVLFSNDAALALADNTASLIEVVATATAAGSVPAPNYSLDVAGLLVSTDVNDVVQSATGTADLTAAPVDPVTGQSYLVVDAAGLDTYAEIDAAFTGALALVLAIPAVDFTLVGVDLTTPKIRTLIVANIVDGIASYQAFEITFNPAP